MESKLPNERKSFALYVLFAASVVAVVVALFGAVVLVFDGLLLMFGALLVAATLGKAARSLSDHTGLPTSIGYALVSIVFLVVLALLLAVTIYLVAQEMQGIGPEMRSLMEDWEAAMQSQPQWLERLRGLLRDSPMSLESLGKSSVEPAIIQKFFSTTFGFGASFLIILVIGLWLGANPDMSLELSLKLAPPDTRPRLREVLHEAGDVLAGWVIGRLFAMTIVGALTSIALWLLSSPMPFVVENFLLTPLVMKKAIDLPPAFLLLAQITLGGLIGGLGVAFAAPLAAGGSVLVNRLYVVDVPVV